MALQLCAVSRSLEMCIEIRLRLEFRPVNHLATQLHNSSSKTHSLACSRWCVSYRVVCDPKIKSGRRMTHTAVRKPTLCTRDALYDTREYAQGRYIQAAERCSARAYQTLCRLACTILDLHLRGSKSALGRDACRHPRLHLALNLRRCSRSRPARAYS